MLSSNLQIMFIVGLVIYLVVLLLAGWYFGKGKSSGEGFLTAGKTISPVFLIGTICATMIGAGSSMGATANGYRFGWGGSIFGLGSALGFLTLLLFTNVRKYNFSTMSDEAQFYYGGSTKIRNLIAVMMFLCECVWVGSGINAGAKYLSFVTGVSDFSAKTAMLVVFTGFSIIGGFITVVITDTIQFFVIIAGFIGIAIRAITLSGGFTQINAVYEAAGKAGATGFYGLAEYGVVAAVSLVLSTYFSALGTPTHRIRIYTAADEKAAKISFSFSSACVFIFSFMPSLIGMACFAISTKEGVILENADYAFSYMATQALGPVLGLIFLISGMSSVLSSADSDALAGVSVLLMDIYPALKKEKVPENKYKKYSRIALVVCMLISYALALYATDVIGYVTNVVGAMLPCVGVAMLLGHFWKRVTWQGGMACICSGLVFGFAYLLIPAFRAWISGIFNGPAIPAALVSCCFGVITSFLTPACTLSEEERLEMVRASAHRR